jgi:hypothetical protein
MVNRLFYWIFFPTACTKSSLTTDGWPRCNFASFIKVSYSSPCNWITHGIFSIHLTKLTMNVSQFHVSCIQETDYRPHFMCSAFLDFLVHCKHTGWCVNVVRLSADCVCAFQKDQQTLHICSGNICKGNVFCGYASCYVCDNLYCLISCSFAVILKMMIRFYVCYSFSPLIKELL